VEMISVLLESIRPGELVFSALEKYHIKIEQHQLLVKYYSEYYQEEFKDLSFANCIIRLFIQVKGLKSMYFLIKSLVLPKFLKSL